MATSILITDAANDEHYTMTCTSRCLIRGIGPDYTVGLEWAARWAREHAIATGHAVEIKDAP